MKQVHKFPAWNTAWFDVERVAKAEIQATRIRAVVVSGILVAGVSFYAFFAMYMMDFYSGLLSAG